MILRKSDDNYFKNYFGSHHERGRASGKLELQKDWRGTHAHQRQSFILIFRKHSTGAGLERTKVKP